MNRFVVHEDFDTQPLENENDNRENRAYVLATWRSHPPPGTSPKESGGVTLSENNHTVIATRSFNRPDQRYQQAVSVIRANRISRRDAEFAACVVLVGRGGHYEIRTPTGNNYDVTVTPHNCDCPDKLRLRLSYEAVDLDCKHILIVVKAINDTFPGTPDYSVGKVGEMTGLEDRTVQHYCKIGAIAATKRHNVWNISPADAEAFALTYRTNIIFPGSIYDDSGGG